MYNATKRLLDLLTASIVMVIFSPIWVLVPLLIVLDSKGPVFYKQKRVGKDGKEFFIQKFRTMYTNADKMLLENEELRTKFKKKSGWKFDVEKDPRITRVGRLLRKFSLDELPQLLNIFEGQMSMVGPRAYRRDDVGDEIEEQLKLYPELKDEMKIALTVKPGLTGPWQTSGRNTLSWDQRVHLDAEYARRQSLWYDVVILFKTPRAMLSKW